jgi:hypothetical protein
VTTRGSDDTNDQMDVTAGVAYVSLAGETVDVQSTLGGLSAPSYETTITASTMPAICVVVPSTQTNLDAQAGTLSSVWLAYVTDGTVTGVSAGQVYLRSEDTGTARHRRTRASSWARLTPRTAVPIPSEIGLGVQSSNRSL